MTQTERVHKARSEALQRGNLRKALFLYISWSNWYELCRENGVADPLFQPSGTVTFMGMIVHHVLTEDHIDVA